MLFLPRVRCRIGIEMSSGVCRVACRPAGPPNGERSRYGSPDGGSILMTSAPRPASSSVQYGPARNRLRSRTTTPSSGLRALNWARSIHPLLAAGPVRLAQLELLELAGRGARERVADLD